MHERIARFNAEANEDLIALKMGAHTGACLAVTLNGRLDYFGQAVNLAARVQALSEGNEIVLTEDLLQAPRVRELVNGHELMSESVKLKGIQGAVRIHRLRATTRVE
jgi:class 3 adenylate cyclase